MAFILSSAHPTRLQYTKSWALGLACLAATTTVFAQGVPMKIRLQVDAETATATLDDTAIARDFAALLPLTLTLTDYAGTERISQLPRKLPLTGSPAGLAPQPGDIAYYAPWGNLAVFVGGDAYAQGLVRLGRVQSGLPLLQRPGPYQVRIERITD